MLTNPFYYLSLVKSCEIEGFTIRLGKCNKKAKNYGCIFLKSSGQIPTIS